jgi:hypothetical protein
MTQQVENVEMLPVPFELKLKILRKLHYSCYPKIMQVNRLMRGFILENCDELLKGRLLFMSNTIPYYFREKFSLKLSRTMQDSWETNTKRGSRDLIKLALLLGANPYMKFTNEDGECHPLLFYSIQDFDLFKCGKKNGRYLIR